MRIKSFFIGKDEDAARPSVGDAFRIGPWVGDCIEIVPCDDGAIYVMEVTN